MQLHNGSHDMLPTCTWLLLVAVGSSLLMLSALSRRDSAVSATGDSTVLRDDVPWR